MSSSKNPTPPKLLVDNASANWRPDASQVASATRGHFAPLTNEEKITYRRWRQATMIFYGTFAIAALLIAIGPTDTTTNAKYKDSNSAVASVAHRNQP